MKAIATGLRRRDRTRGAERSRAQSEPPSKSDRAEPAAGRHPSSPLLPARTNHADGHGGTIAPGPDVGPTPPSNSAADTASLERLGFRIAGLKQPSACRGQTTEAVALQRRRHESPRGIVFMWQRSG